MQSNNKMTVSNGIICFMARARSIMLLVGAGIVGGKVYRRKRPLGSSAALTRAGLPASRVKANNVLIRILRYITKATKPATVAP